MQLMCTVEETIFRQYRMNKRAIVANIGTKLCVLPRNTD